MNRKKIALLLTGLMITSTTFMGCTNNNKTSDNNSKKIVQEQPDDSMLRRASEREVTEYNQQDVTPQYPDVAYADDLGNVEDNQLNNNNNNNLDGSRSNTITNGDYEMVPSNDTNQNNAFGNGTSGINGNNGIMPNSEDTNGGNYGFESPLSEDPTQNYNFGGTSSNENEFRGFSSATNDDYETGFNEGTNFQNNGTRNNGQAETNLWDSNNSSNSSSSTQNGQTTPNTNGMNTDMNSSNSNSSTNSNYNSNNSMNSSNSMNNSTSAIDTNDSNLNTTDSTNGLNSGDDINDKMNQIAPYAVVEDSKVAGNISVVRARGNSEMTKTTSGGSTTINPQGTAEISIKLSGDVLNAQSTTLNNASLSTLLQNAYEETRQDANTGYSGTPTLTARENLREALVEIFDPSDDDIKLIFKSANGAVSTIPFVAEEMFPDTTKSPNYSRYIIDLEGTSGQYRSGAARTARSINSSDIVIRMLVRVETPSSTVGLKTNTEYSFVGTESDLNFKVTPSDSSKPEKEQLIGFSVPNFTTAKTPSKLTATDKDSNSVIYEGTASDAAGTKHDDFYLSQTTDKTYIDLNKLRTVDAGQESPVKPMGTTIKFTNLIFNDTDKTITNIEIQDDRNVKHKCILTSVDSNDEKKGSYLEVTGLTRNTGYVFTKLLVTSKVGSNSETKTIHFANFDAASTTLEINKEQISTTAFSEPQLKLAGDATDTATLPNGLKIPTVKNDINSLRYIVRVDNPEGFIGDIRVNGLKSTENSKVEKIVDTKTKVNYYVVTLYNLKKDTDYGFIILETDYKDPDGRELVGRQALNTINPVTGNDNTTTDNRTETTALTGTNAFNVLVNESVKVTDARRADVPIFIDDMNGRFLRVEFTPPQENPTAEVEYVDNKLRFTNLKPDSSTVCKVDFIYSGENSTEEKISKYIRVTTPKVEDLDIKSTNITIDKDNNVNIKFDLYSEEKSPVKSVKVTDSADKEVTSTWDKATRTLTLQNLEENKEYSNLKVVFTLENNKRVEYTLDTFTTGVAEVKPTGPVADFVSRVYKIALGREPEVEGWNFWINKLQSKELNATEFIAENLMTQPEFVDRELSKRNFVMTMYSLIVNREADDEGRTYWERKYDEYRAQTTSIEKLRIKIAREMMDQAEFKDLITQLNLKY